MTEVERIDGAPMNAQSVRALFTRQQERRWPVALDSAKERRAKLVRLRQAIRDHSPAICQALAADFGKPPAETELTELVPTLEELNHAIRHVARWMKPRRVPTPLTLLGATSEVRYAPKGVVLVLAPWNYPFYLAVNPVIAAVAAGNCVMLRPSDKTRHTARAIRDVLAAAFDPEEVAVVLGGREVADALLELPFDHIFFTGSQAVGRKVMASAAAHLTPVTLELGGKSPAIVDEGADLRSAGERVAWGKFLNGGQTCVAPDYALVHESVAAAFVVEVRQAVERFYGVTEDARLASGDLCQMVDQAACERLERVIRDTVAAGATLAFGGRVDLAKRRVAPTVLTGVRPEHPIMQDEIFGPVLPVVTYRALDEAIAFVRRRPQPLALYVFSADRRAVARVLTQTSAGGTCVNNAVLHLANPHLPFGGVGQSGMGHYHGRYGFETFSHCRAVLRQKWPPIVRLLYPPYTARVYRLLALVRKLFG